MVYMAKDMKDIIINKIKYPRMGKIIILCILWRIEPYLYTNILDYCTISDRLEKDSKDSKDSKGLL